MYPFAKGLSSLAKRSAKAKHTPAAAVSETAGLTVNGVSEGFEVQTVTALFLP